MNPQGELSPHNSSQPIHICGVPESALAVAAAQVCKWPFHQLTWSVADPLPGLSDDAWQEAFRLALSYWSAVCWLDFEYTPNARTAHILATAGRIDGPSGTLAWSELPCGNPRQLTQKYDTGEQRWVVSESPRGGELDIVRVVCHEVGHALGMQHIGAGNLLAPTYSASIRRPQPGDVAEMVRRYGRRPAAVPTPVPVPPPNPVPIPQPSGGIMGTILKTLLLNALRAWVENLLKSGQLEKFLQDFLNSILTQKPQTVEALVASATDAAAKNGVTLS